MRRLVLSLLFTAACSGPSQAPPQQETPPQQQHETPEHAPPPATADVTATMVDGVYYSLPGAPPPRACAADADCLVDTVPDAAGCCIGQPMGLHPQSWAWHTWMSQHRMSPACSDAHCPPPPAPMPPNPNDCHMQGLCTAHVCGDSCAVLAEPSGS